ncbi:MAG: dTMP kinase [Myxococcota bacterium]|nr:dTMP kinase [Myxococcota bacterium]
MAGCLIAFEGIDGSGKSTQVKRLASALRDAHHEVCETREPTDGEHGRKIRALSTRGAPLSLQEELDLFEKDRREHVHDLIAPALGRGEIVITDRYFLSTAAYQGARGLDSGAILRSHEALFPLPDVVFLIEVPVAAALLRVEARGEEKNQSYEKQAFLEEVAQLFRSFDRDYICSIPGDASESAVHEAVRSHFTQRPGLPSL